MYLDKFKFYPTIDDGKLERLLEENLGESFDEIATMINPEYSNDSYSPLFIRDHNGEIYQEEICEYDSEETQKNIRKMNLARRLLFDWFGDKYDRILVDVSW